jgi:hypothetical protein
MCEKQFALFVALTIPRDNSTMIILDVDDVASWLSR